MESSLRPEESWAAHGFASLVFTCRLSSYDGISGVKLNTFSFASNMENYNVVVPVDRP